MLFTETHGRSTSQRIHRNLSNESNLPLLYKKSCPLEHYGFKGTALLRLTVCL